MKFVALISGGKDSCFNVCKCIKFGHQLVACAHLCPQNLELERDSTKLPNETEELDSFMYQTVGSSAVQCQAECFGVPFYQKQIVGGSLNQSLQYGQTEGDEVEDLYHLLADIKRELPDVEAVASGAIFSTYQRTRVENVCVRLGLTSLSFLWQRSQVDLLDEMIDNQVEAVLVKVASAGLDPYRHLGKSISALRPYFHSLQNKFGFHVCGEGGEYETMTLDCPAFQRRLVLDETTLHIESGDVGMLQILKCHTEEKDAATLEAHSSLLQPTPEIITKEPKAGVESSDNILEEQVDPSLSNSTLMKLHLPVYKRIGHVFIGNISVPDPNTTAVEQTNLCLGLLKEMLEKEECSMGDICFMHFLLDDISLFGEVNAAYCRWFAGMPAPSRSCVQACLLPGTHVAMACLAQAGSCKSMSEGNFSRRQVLHVQSISCWAPVCIGPYSQANILYGHLIKMSGQIGLDPVSMALVPGNWEQQLFQSMKNCAQVLSVLDSSLSVVLNMIVYVNSALVPSMQGIMERVRELVSQNAFVPDSWALEEHGDVYESDWNSDPEDEMDPKPSSPENSPIALIGVPGLPKDALVEVEIVATSRHAHRLLCLQRQQTCAYLNFQPELVAGPGWIPWPSPPASMDAPDRNKVEGKTDEASDNTTSKARFLLHSKVSSMDSIFHFSIHQIKRNRAYPSETSEVNIAAAELHDTFHSISNCVKKSLLEARLGQKQIVEIKIFYGTQQWKGLTHLLYGTASINFSMAVDSLVFSPVSHLEDVDTLLCINILAYDLPRLETELWIREKH